MSGFVATTKARVRVSRYTPPSGRGLPSHKWQAQCGGCAFRRTTWHVADIHNLARQHVDYEHLPFYMEGAGYVEGLFEWENVINPPKPPAPDTPLVKVTGDGEGFALEFKMVGCTFGRMKAEVNE